MKRKQASILLGICFIYLAGCANSLAFLGPKETKYSIRKVNSEKKYLHMMSRTRGILGTSNWGKFNYEVVPLPYEKQGEYFTVTWKRSGGPKVLDQDLICRIDAKHVDGKVARVEKVFPQSKRGSHTFIFENTGDIFVDNGEIELWKVSLIVDGEVVSEQESQLWWTVGQPKS